MTDKLFRYQFDNRKSIILRKEPAAPILDIANSSNLNRLYFIYDKTCGHLPLRRRTSSEDGSFIYLRDTITPKDSIEEFYLCLVVDVLKQKYSISLVNGNNKKVLTGNVYELNKQSEFIYKCGDFDKNNISFLLRWNLLNFASSVDVYDDDCYGGSDIINSPLTNTCTKCGYYNEYLDPTPGYICRQCKTRDNIWS